MTEMNGFQVDDEFDELDGLTDEETFEQRLEDTASLHEANEEEIKWRQLELHRQFFDVIELLVSKTRRWDSTTGDESIPVLEEYKKITFTTAEDVRDLSTPTALHYLAKHKKEFSEVSKDIQHKIISHLLSHKFPNTQTLDCVRKEYSFLLVATDYNNVEFIDCVEECLEDRFTDLLDLQDGAGKNYLHHLFTYNPEKTPIDMDSFISLIRRLASKAKPHTIAAADNEGNTPIHYSISQRQCQDKPDEYCETVKAMILAGDSAMKEQKTLFNNAGESPITYCRNRIREVKEARAKSNQNRTKLSQTKRSAQRVLGPTVAPDLPDLPPRIGAQGSTDYRYPGQKGFTIETGIGRPRTDSGTASMLREPMTPAGTEATIIKEPTMRDPRLEDKSSQPSLSRSNTTEQQTQAPNQGVPLKRGSGTASAKVSRGIESERGSKGVPQRDRNKACRELREFLTTHYIRTRSDMEARDLLFRGDVEELPKNLCFDAKGQQEARRIVDLLGRMSSGGFYSTLAYVHLPTVAHNPTSTSRARLQGTLDRATLPENPNTGRTELISVFKTLYDMKVRKILRLHVEDRHPPSHTDAAIEIALQGRESSAKDGVTEERRPIMVETWDWRKPDLSTEVIAFAAPTVEHVNLYWSGNPAVLRAWDCDEGIPRLYLTTERRLKTVTIYAAPGIESRKRMDGMLSRFKQEVIRKTGGGVTVKIYPRMDGLMADIDAGEDTTGPVSDDAAEKHHSWVETMDTFRKTLNTLPNLKESKAPRVKLALIDDGINLSNLDMYNGNVKVNGLSFNPRQGRSENPWHCSSTGHGTVLANMIVRVNPWVELYVLRIHDEASRSGGGRNIYASSAAKAVQAAIELKVNIISMSWTIKNSLAGGHNSPIGIDSRKGSFSDTITADQVGIQALGDAIDSAKAAGIIMFCSASDDIQASAMDTLPYQRQPGYIFRIGAALSQGQRDPNSEDTKRINYYFPGNQVAEAKNPRSSEPARYHDGSSVSTALAAGLASMIMYCARLASQHQDDKKELGFSDRKNPYAELAVALRYQQNLKQAFDNIKTNSWDNPKYLPVWGIFKHRAEEMEKAKKEDKWEVLERLVTQLSIGIN